MVNIENLLRIELFRHATEQELSLLTQASSIKTVSRGETIVNQNDLPTHVYFILAGACMVQLNGKSGKEIIIKDLNEGDYFGELSVLCNAKRCASVLTRNDSTLLIVSAEAYVYFCNNNLHASQITISRLAKSLSKITKDFQSLAMDNLNHRLIKVLLEVSTKEKNKLLVNLTHSQLATRASSTRESVSRVISEFKKNGLIRTHEHEIEIDQSLLELYSQL